MPQPASPAFRRFEAQCKPGDGQRRLLPEELKGVEGLFFNQFHPLFRMRQVYPCGPGHGNSLATNGVDATACGFQSPILVKK